MAVTSDLAALYQAVYNEAPSYTSQIELLRMEKLLGLKPNDAFSRMLIVQVRSAERMEHTRQALEGGLEQLAPLLQTATTLAGELDRSVGVIARRNRGIPMLLAQAAALVETRFEPFPLAAYLSYAFRRRGLYRNLADNERIAAARWDVFFLLGGLALAFLAGAACTRLGKALHWHP